MAEKYIQISTMFALSKGYSPSEMMSLIKYVSLRKLQCGEPSEKAMKSVFRSKKMRDFVLAEYPYIESYME